ncbi:Ig-like domain-containing protein [Halospeciosus flavus]|uniref:Ig-like domain-containing protein n=1 Tax=Halospeciosus flavus TaxID=3032283 RepID=A0ABD5Z9R0_9EURY|nr:Ig-like domain-containing protein [Halospeciosus flavus]
MRASDGIVKLRDDRRGVSTVVGAVLVFGILVVLLSLYQAQVVPAQNEAVEFQHAQAVQSDMVHLRDGLLRTASSGNTYPTSVALGARYPSRIFFVNPPPVNGRLTTETVGGGQIIVDNAKALDGETADYWGGGEHTFASKSLVYEAEYNYLDDSPRIGYENTLLYRNYTSENATLIDARPTVVDGSEITLVALGGNLTEGGSESASVAPRPVSAPYTEIAVTNASKNITITLPTALPVAKWNQTLASEYDTDPNDGDDRHLLAVERTGSGAVRLVLEPGTYTLKMAKLGVGTGVERPGAHYLTEIRGGGATVQVGGTERLVAQVRDRFNNPVAGVSVNATAESGRVSPTSATSGEQGKTAFIYQAPDSISDASETVNVTASYGPNQRQTVTFEVRVVSAGGTGGSGNNPTFDTFTVKDQSNGSQARFEVHWKVSDTDANLDTVEFHLRRNDTIVDSTAVNIQGKSANDKTTLTESDGYGKSYTIVGVVTDTQGNEAKRNTTDTAGGTNP